MTTTAETATALARLNAPSEQRTFQDLMIRMAPEIEKALPRAIGSERFARLALTEMRRNPILFDCKPESVLGALMLCAQLGLEPGPLGHAYLVPYKRECVFVLGYKGMIDLARRSGRLASIEARTVYEGDTFEYEYGTRAKLVHRPCPPSDRGKETCWYGLAKFAAPVGVVFNVLYPEDVEAARKRSVLGKEGKGPWHTDFDAMARKTCIRRLAPYLPMTVQAARAVEADERPVVELAEGEVTLEDAQADGERGA